MPEEKTPAHHGTHDGKVFCHCHSGKHGVLLIVSVQFNMIDLNYKKYEEKFIKICSLNCFITGIEFAYPMRIYQII